jgi:DNA-binding SARP family transcriptional activator
MALTLRILTPPRERPGDVIVDGPKAYVALVLIVLRSASREDLRGLLWPNAPRSRGLHSVRVALTKIRKAVGADALVEDGDRMSIVAGRVQLDSTLVERALDAGDLARAFGLWSADPFRRFPRTGVRDLDREIEEIRDRLERRLVGAFVRRADDHASSGSFADALGCLDSALAVRTFDEDVHVRRLDLLLEGGRLGEAAAALREAQSVLGDSTTRGFQERLDRALRERGGITTTPPRARSRWRSFRVPESWTSCRGSGGSRSRGRPGPSPWSVRPGSERRGSSSDSWRFPGGRARPSCTSKESTPRA